MTLLLVIMFGVGCSEAAMPQTLQWDPTTTLVDEDADLAVAFEFSGCHLDHVSLRGASSFQYFMLIV
jgi:hypothetical protein